MVTIVLEDKEADWLIKQIEFDLSDKQDDRCPQTLFEVYKKISEAIKNKS